MERLEISIIKYSEIDHIKNRIDSEYYMKKYLSLSKRIKKIGEITLPDIEVKIDCSAFYPSIVEFYNFSREGIPFLRVNEIKNGLVTITDNTTFLPQKLLDSNKSTIAIGYPGDLIIAKGGNTLAKVGLITDEYKNYALSRDIILLRTNNLVKYNKYFLWVFLHSDYGQDLLWRTASQTGQPHLTLPSIKDLKLPKYSSLIENKIEEIYKLSISIKRKSQILYKQAEKELLHEIGLDEHLTNSNSEDILNYNIKSFKESFGITGRLDAEYYQKKYEKIVKKIKTQKYDILKNIATIVKSIEPGSKYYSDGNVGLPFMRVADFNKFGLSEPNKKLNFDFIKDNHEKINDLKPKKGSILFSKDGTVGMAFQLQEDFEGVTSGAILNLNVKNEKQVVPEYLTLVLNSDLVQMQAERDAGGSIILHWRVGEINNVIVPIIDYKIQRRIETLVKESFSLKKHSEHLLDVAKRAVEIAIEDNEKKAMEFINKKLQNG
ncbi:hypothetical protein ACWA1F_22565 [Flavobacterium sp. 3-218]